MLKTNYCDCHIRQFFIGHVHCRFKDIEHKEQDRRRWAAWNCPLRHAKGNKPDVFIRQLHAEPVAQKQSEGLAARHIPMVIKTGNGIADIVINQKRAIALDKKIKFEVTAYINDYVKITLSDLCVLLSNSLDNAIEASELVADERKRIISLKVKTHKQFLMIEVENYADNDPIYVNGSLATRKKDAANHGLGMLSMRSIAEKYNGTIEHKYADNIFRLTIILNI